MTPASEPRDRRVALAGWVVRVALAASFLSAVADRLGFWGPPGTAGVAWGSVAKYEEYVAVLNGFLPASLVPAVGWAATAAEALLAAGLLLTAFAAAMVVALGPKPPLDYSVPSAAGAAFLLAAVSPTAGRDRR